MTRPPSFHGTPCESGRVGLSALYKGGKRGAAWCGESPPPRGAVSGFQPIRAQGPRSPPQGRSSRGGKRTGELGARPVRRCGGWRRQGKAKVREPRWCPEVARSSVSALRETVSPPQTHACGCRALSGSPLGASGRRRGPGRGGAPARRGPAFPAPPPLRAQPPGSPVSVPRPSGRQKSS